MQFLIELHGFFDFIVFDEQCFGTVELFIQNCEPGLNFVELNAFALAVRLVVFFFVVVNHFVNFSEIGCLRNVSQSSITMFRDDNILVFQRQFGQSFPVGFSLRVHLDGVKDIGSLLQIVILDRKSKLNQRFLKGICDCIISFIDNDFGLTAGSFNGFNVTFNIIDGDLIRVFNTIPHAEIVAILSDHDITFRYPLCVTTVAQQGVFGLLFNVIEMKLSLFISEQKFIAVRVKFEEINFGIMIYLSDIGIVIQIGYAYRLGIEQIGYDLRAFVPWGRGTASSNIIKSC